MAMRNRRRGVLLLVLLAACSQSSLPPLPTVNTSEFSPSIRADVDRQFAVVRAAPRDAERAGRLGMLLHAHDRLDAAAVCYERARLLAPSDYRWLYLSGVVEASQSRHKEAAELFRKALAQKRDDVPAQLRLADALLASGDSRGSRELYEKVMMLRPA